MTTAIATNYAQDFAVVLNEKFIGDSETFHIEAGRKLDKIVQTYNGRRSVYAFVEKATGNLIKSATWKAPQKNVDGTYAVRYNLATDEGFAEALENADRTGGFLYADYVKK